MKMSIRLAGYAAGGFTPRNLLAWRHVNADPVSSEVALQIRSRLVGQHAEDGEHACASNDPLPEYTCSADQLRSVMRIRGKGASVAP